MSRPPQYMSQLSPTSLNRMGQPPIQRTNHGRSSVIYGNEGIHPKPPHSSFSYDPVNAHAFGSNSFNNGATFGMHEPHPSVLPSTYCHFSYLCVSFFPIFLFWRWTREEEDSYKYCSFDGPCHCLTGRRTNLLVNLPPSSRGRKDYGRISWLADRSCQIFSSTILFGAGMEALQFGSSQCELVL